MPRRPAFLILTLAMALLVPAVSTGAEQAAPRLRLVSVSTRVRTVRLRGKRLVEPTLARLQSPAAPRPVPILTPRGAPPPPSASPLLLSDVEMRSARVQHAMFIFHPNEPAMTFTSIDDRNDLERLRARDRMLLFREPTRPGVAMSLGMAVFGGAIVFAAHAPRPLRVLLDGPGHFGPAIFDSGVGAGVQVAW